MNGLRIGDEDDLPPRLAEPVRPVGLLAEHEESLVEETNGISGLTPHEQNSTLERFDLARRVVMETAAVESVQYTGARRKLAQEQVLGREPPDRGEAPYRALQRPVGVDQPRPRKGDVWMHLRVHSEPV